MDYTPTYYGDVLFAGSGETIDEIGKSAVNLLNSNAVCGGDIILLRLNIGFDAKYIGYVTNCRSVAIQKSKAGRGITIMHVYSNELKYVTVSLPPISEQTAIACYLDGISTAIDSTVTHTHLEIGLMNEYRTRLHAEVVTGKLDVRNEVKPRQRIESAIDE